MTPTRLSVSSRNARNAINASAIEGAGAKRAKAIGATTGAEALAVADAAVAKAGNGRTLPGILRGRNPLPGTRMPRKNVTSVNRLGT